MPTKALKLFQQVPISNAQLMDEHKLPLCPLVMMLSPVNTQNCTVLKTAILFSSFISKLECAGFKARAKVMSN